MEPPCKGDWLWKRSGRQMPVPEAGKKYYGLGRNASYAAAKRGDIPTITIGRRIFAIVSAIERQLGLIGSHE